MRQRPPSTTLFPYTTLFRSALLPIISPPFAVAMSTILLFGRSGAISKGMFGIENNIYGLQGLTIVQVVTFFPVAFRSEEHTSELQSQSNLVCRLLLEKKKTQ